MYWGLDLVTPENLLNYAEKTIFRSYIATSLTYAFQFEKITLPQYLKSVTRTIYTQTSEDKEYRLTLKEVLAQIPPELENQKVLPYLQMVPMRLSRIAIIFK